MPSHTLHDCYHAIIRSAQNKPGRLINYGASYAAYGLKLPDAVKTDELTPESRIQATYVRANLSGWRGEEAQAVRRSIDKILGRA